MTLRPARSLAIHCTTKRARTGVARRRRSAARNRTARRTRRRNKSPSSCDRRISITRISSGARARACGAGSATARRPGRGCRPRAGRTVRNWTRPPGAAGRPRRHERSRQPSRGTSAGKKRCRASKYGSARKTSRRNALRPQPVSRVPSFSSALRTPLAMRDWSFLNAACPCADAAGRRRGPTPGPASRLATHRGHERRIVLAIAVEGDETGARAARTPVRTAALWPQLAACAGSRSQGRARASGGEPRLRAVGRAVVDVDDLEGRETGALAARSRRAAARSSPASFFAGTTKLTRGAPASPFASAITASRDRRQGRRGGRR